ncbi:MAG: YicC family protein [Gammaproteobacteria bacterium]|nr:YicC family protein [Gammaproteobacteria bacterium]
MIRSMTAFAREEARGDWGNAAWELRSVNHRYLDTSIRLPEDFRPLEPKVREAVSKRIGRGKVECQLRIQLAQNAGSVEVNQELLNGLVTLNVELSAKLGPNATVNTMDLLRWPGVVETPPLDSDVIYASALACLDLAVDELVAAREREGENIATMIAERLDGIEQIRERVALRLPQIIATQRTRLSERLNDIREELDASRLEQEMVMFAQRIDVAEELDRLGSHVSEVRRALKDKKPVGRRLDFLMQELNREANTLGSKSVDTETTNAAVDLKVIIEQMREQVQNVE